MEKIIQKAIEGGYDKPIHENSAVQVCEPTFWQALGKACGWGYEKGKYEMFEPAQSILRTIDENNGKRKFTYEGWLKFAINFHEKNLTEGWDASVKWLEELINN